MTVFGLRRGGVHADDGADFEAEAAELHDGGALGMAGEVGDGDGLRAEAFDAADVPFAADDGAGRGGLGEDAAGGDFGAVEAVVDGHLDAELGGFGEGLLRGEALEAGDFDLGSVDDKAHGDDGRSEGDEGEAEDKDYELEEAEHCFGFKLSLRG